MYKVFARIEGVLLGMALLGFGLVISSVPNGSIMLVISLGSLAILYALSGYLQPSEAGEQVANQAGLVGKISGLALAALLVGFLAKFMLWGGFSGVLQVGLGGTLTMAIATFFLARTERKRTRIWRSAVWLVLGTGILLAAPASLFKLHHPNDPVMLEKFTAREAHPGDPVYQIDYDNYRRQQQAQKHAK